jgi:hypothetical protein
MSYVNPNLAKLDISKLSEHDVLDALDKHYTSLRKFVRGVAQNKWHLIVNGDAGMGKTETVNDVLDAVENVKVDSVSGTISPVLLYGKLQENSKRNSILVIDDSDKTLEDTECLEVLKASLDSKEDKTVDWTKYSTVLNKKNLKTSFKYEGRTIIITNKMLRTAPSEMPTTQQQRVSPLLSRVHYFKAGVPSTQWKIAAIKMHKIGYESKWEPGVKYELRCLKGVSLTIQNEVIDWLEQHQDELREISFRIVKILVDLIEEEPDFWEELASASLLY